MPSTVAVCTGNDELLYVGTRSFNSQGDRRERQEVIGPGVYDASDWKASYAGSGLNLQINAGIAYVRGFAVEQGLYRCRQSTNVTTLSCAANASGNPRIDRVILRVYDNDSEAAGSYQAQVEVLTGSTAVAGATLDNLTGAVDLTTIAAPKTVLLIADVLIPSGAASILNSNIRDRRAFCTQTLPQLDFTTYDGVCLQPCDAIPYGTIAYDSSYALHQSAALFWNPRRIIGVTRARWRYATEVTIGSGTNWNMAICDASGRIITSTGNVLLTSATGDTQVNQAWASAFDLDVGWCYIAFGIGNLVTGRIRYTGALLDSAATSARGPYVQNVGLRSATAGNTFGSGGDANTIRYLTDAYNVANGTLIGVPQVVLSVG